MYELDHEMVRLFLSMIVPNDIILQMLCVILSLYHNFDMISLKYFIIFILIKSLFRFKIKLIYNNS